MSPSLSHQRHSGNKSKSHFTCCNVRALAQGCCTAKCHVWRGKLFSSPGMHGPFSGYIRTRKVRLNIIYSSRTNSWGVILILFSIFLMFTIFKFRGSMHQQTVTMEYMLLIVRCVIQPMAWR